MLPEERRRQIQSLIVQEREVSIDNLASRLDVSPSTVRRDLDQLASKGFVQRVYGGAVALEQAAPPEPPVIDRIENADEKRRIGQAAAQLIQDGDTVFFGSGTTTLQVVKNLGDKKNLTVVTNALTVASELASRQDITMVVVGGLLRHSELSLVGHIAQSTLQTLHVSKVVMGVRAIHLEKGITNDYLPETKTELAISQLAPELIVVCDHSKFGKVSTASVFPVARIGKLVTDAATPPGMIKEIEELGVEVIVV